MSLLGRATHLSRAVKNVGRVREIVSAMSRFGFGALIYQWNLGKFIPGSETRWLKSLTKADSSFAELAADERLPRSLRLLLEDLGPAFIKIGQILAGRPDLLPERFIKELEMLQDKVAPVDFTQLQTLIEQDLGRPLGECFSSIDPIPLATASIAQVHVARTLEGDDVVLKVKKPNVDKILRQDLEIIEFFAALTEEYVLELRPFRPTEIVTEFKRTLLAETNFRLEVLNTKRFRDNFAGNTFLVVPKIYTDLSGDHCICLERLRGVKLSQIEKVKEMGLDPIKIMDQSMDCFYKSIMLDGFFHADPHAGNILILPDGRMGLLDFGSVARLSDSSRMAIVNMFMALMFEDFEGLVEEYVMLSPNSEAALHMEVLQRIQKKVRDIMLPYFGMPLKDIPSGKILMEASHVAFQNQVRIPQEMILVFKAIMTLEGIGKALNPNFDLMASATKYTKDLLADRFKPNRLGRHALVYFRDVLRLTSQAPKVLATLLRQVEAGRFKVQHQMLEFPEWKATQHQNTKLVSSAIILAASMASLSYSQVHLIIPAWLLIGLWGSIGFFGLITLWKLLRL